MYYDPTFDFGNDVVQNVDFLEGYHEKPVILNMYAIYDNAARVYQLPLLPLQNDAVAVRMFKQFIQPGTNLYNYPEDFEIHWIGYFDQKNGVLVNEYDGTSAVVVAKAEDFIDEIKAIYEEKVDDVQEHLREEESGEDR